MNDMSTAPQGCMERALILARWHWSSHDPEHAGERYEWRAAEYWGDGEWRTLSSNPYEDVALEPRGWLPMPPVE